MNILLIYPRSGYKNAGNISPPLGLLYLAAVARKHGHRVSLNDMIFQNNPEIAKDQLRNIDVVGVSFLTSLADRAYDILKKIKSMKPEVKCIAGGPHPTVDAEECLRNGFDAVVIGEGEYTFIELMEKMGSPDSLHSVNGIAFLENNKVVITPPRVLIDNLDELPFPARDLIDWGIYPKTDPTVTLISSRGCPYHCLFCKPMQEKLFGKEIRRRTPSNVVDELQNIERESKMPDYLIFFVDDTFLFSRDWIVSFCNEIKKRGVKVRWICQARVDNINIGLLKIIKEAGCLNICIGVESGSQKILDFLRKGTRVKDIIRAFDLCRMAGLSTHAFVIVGSPMETKKDLDDTVRLIKRIRPSSVDVSRLTPMKGSDLYEFSVANGLLTVNSYEEYDYYTSNTSPLRLSYVSVKDLEHYTNTIRNIVLNDNFKKLMWNLVSNPLYLKKFVVKMFQNPELTIMKIKRTIIRLLASVFGLKKYLKQ